MQAPEDTAAERHFTTPSLIEDIARELFYEDWDREHTINLVDSGEWESCPEEIKENYYRKEARVIGNIFKDWLRTVGIPNEHFPAVEATRQLLITMVDEP